MSIKNFYFPRPEGAVINQHEEFLLGAHSAPKTTNKENIILDHEKLIAPKARRTGQAIAKTWTTNQEKNTTKQGKKYLYLYFNIIIVLIIIVYIIIVIYHYSYSLLFSMAWGNFFL